MYQTAHLAEDANLQQRLLLSLHHMERTLAPVLQGPRRREEPVIRITERIAQLFPDADHDQEMLFRIGKAASVNHERIYGMPPPKRPQLVGNAVKLVNVYTMATVRMTLDPAIQDELDNGDDE